MFEKFTDRARKVMALANQEAQRFNHNYIGTEHILLGLVKEGSGVGSKVLKKLDVDLDNVRIEVEKLVKKGNSIVAMGKLPLTPRAQTVLEYAIEEARNLGNNYVGTEHLLLGLLREKDGVAAQILMNLKINPNQGWSDVQTLLKTTGSDVDIRPPVNGPDAIGVWEYAREEARTLGHRHVENGHLLLGLLHAKDGISAKVLVEMGVNLEELRERTLKRLGELPRK